MQLNGNNERKKITRELLSLGFMAVEAVVL